MDKFKDTFREEAYELLVSLEDYLLQLEKDPANKDLISAVFRVMHTIKGSSAMFGFDQISTFTHEIESIMDEVRSGVIKVNNDIISLTLQSRDIIRELLDPGEKDDNKLKSDIEKIVNRFKQEVRQERSDEIAESEPETDISESENEENDTETTYRISYVPNESTFLSGTNPILLLKELSELGDYSVIAHTEKIPDLKNIDAEKCYIYWEIILTSNYTINRIRDVFIFVESDSRLSIDVIDDDDSLPEKEYKKLGEILVHKGIIQEDNIAEALKGQKRIGEVLLENKLVNEADLEAALEEQEHMKRAMDRKANAVNTLRVSSEKLDELVDLVGELVTLQARLSQMTTGQKDSQFATVAEHLERLSSDLRDNTMSLRMLPIGMTFSRYTRLVRDLSAELGKKINLETEGQETELDKSVLDKLNDPLVHLIRNSIDHGIERPADRKKIGKPETGTIKLSAMHSGAFVIITIEDDGAGINREELIKKAVEKGLIENGNELSDNEAFDLIFHPGISTAGKVTSVSGRGVGMDVVKKEISGLRGHIRIDSKPGKGTKIMLSIPLTLAIIEGLLVRIERDYFVIPLSSVESCIEFSAEERKLHPNRNVINYRGEVLPIIRLKDIFGIEGELQDIEQIVVISGNDMTCGFIVDEVVGDYQTVIKSLGLVFRDVAGVSGATILGDGSIALILDIAKLANMAKELEKDRVGNDR
ncbi:MAG: chemotaxis protein CheA [Spirochaetales bacterium]|nr:chemotaxis protein CheA [Spirochaetales bacterium]